MWNTYIYYVYRGFEKIEIITINTCVKSKKPTCFSLSTSSTNFRDLNFTSSHPTFKETIQKTSSQGGVVVKSCLNPNFLWESSFYTEGKVVLNFFFESLDFLDTFLSRKKNRLVSFRKKTFVSFSQKKRELQCNGKYFHEKAQVQSINTSVSNFKHTNHMQQKTIAYIPAYVDATSPTSIGTIELDYIEIDAGGAISSEVEWGTGAVKL